MSRLFEISWRGFDLGQGFDSLHCKLEAPLASRSLILVFAHWAWIIVALGAILTLGFKGQAHDPFPVRELLHRGNDQSL